MKKVFVLIAIVMMISSCSFVKDVQSHCKFTDLMLDTPSGSFKTCLECDSLAQVVRKQIAKVQK